MFGQLITRWLFPLPNDYDQQGPSLQELKAEFRNWYLFSILLVLPLCAIAIFAIFHLLKAISAWNASRFQGAFFHLYDDGNDFPFLALPAFFLGMITAGLAGLAIMRLLLGDRFRLFIRYESLLFQIDSLRAAKYTAIFFGIVSTLLAAAMINVRTVFQQNDVEFHSFFLLPTDVRSYSDIDDIFSAPQIRAPNGNAIDRRVYVIHFKDGGNWSTDRTLATLDDDQKLQLAEFVAQRTKLPIRQIPIWE